MAFTPLTDADEARAMLASVLRPDARPTLTTEEMDRLVLRAASLADDGVTTQYTAAGLNTAAALGCQYKAAAAADQFDAGVGPGKSFTLSQVYDHWMQQSALYGSGQLSVVGSVDVDDGTGKPGAYTTIGRIGLTSVMNTRGS